jgi:hypothetical protein
MSSAGKSWPGSRACSTSVTGLSGQFDFHRVGRFPTAPHSKSPQASARAILAIWRVRGSGRGRGVAGRSGGSLPRGSARRPSVGRGKSIP